MPSYHNIEKRAFRRGQYTGWDANGNRYLIQRKRERGPWWVELVAKRAPGLPTFYAGTLALVSLRLERMSAICAMPRLEHEKACGQ